MAALLGRIDRIRDTVSVLFLAAIVVLINLQVFFRYVVNDPLSWPEEIARTLFLWIAYLGVAKLYRERGHYIIDFFINLTSVRMRALAAVFVDLLALASFLIAFCAAWPILEANAHLRTAIGMPINFLYASLPAATILIVPAIIWSITMQLRIAAGRAPEDSFQKGPLA